MTDLKNGANIDNRKPQEKIKDYKFEETVVSANPVNWVKRKTRSFPIFNQNGSGSCVAQTQAKEMGIMRFLEDGNYVHFSASHIYKRRVNRPGGGMIANDCRKIASEGVTLEVLAPSQSMTDSEMDNLKIEKYKEDVGKIFKVPNYVDIAPRDINTIASIIEKTGKGVMVWFYFSRDEWTDRPKVNNPNLSFNDALKHSVIAVDYTLTEDGKRALIIEDSWGPNATKSGGQRTIDEDFFKARNWLSSYLINFKYKEADEEDKFKYEFNYDLEFGMRNDTDIIYLQEVLKSQGLFPKNIESTGYFGSITKKAVQNFQLKYKITGTNGRGYGRVGPKTRAKLNSL